MQQPTIGCVSRTCTTDIATLPPPCILIVKGEYVQIFVSEREGGRKRRKKLPFLCLANFGSKLVPVGILAGMRNPAGKPLGRVRAAGKALGRFR